MLDLFSYLKWHFFEEAAVGLKCPAALWWVGGDQNIHTFLYESAGLQNKKITNNENEKNSGYFLFKNYILNFLINPIFIGGGVFPCFGIFYYSVPFGQMKTM